MQGLDRLRPPPSDAAPRVGPRDLGIASALFLVLWLANVLLAQDALYGDGESMLLTFEPLYGPSKLWSHTLLLLVARALRALGVGETPFHTLRMVSLVAGAVGAAATYLLARGFGARRASSLAAALLLAATPGWLFFSTTIEVHALHAACFALAGCAVVFAPWQRPALAVALCCLAFPPIVLSHETGPILGAGLLGMVQVGRERRGLAPLGLPTLCGVIGPVFLAVLVASFLWNTHLAGSTLGANLDRQIAEGKHFSSEVTLATFIELWLQPLGLLLPLAVAAALAGALAGWRLVALAAAVLPSLALFTSWGVIERGGYTLPSATALAVAGALLFSTWGEGPRALSLKALPVALHGLLALASLSSYVGPRWEDYTVGRSAVAREVLGTPCALYALNYRNLFLDLEGGREVNLYPLLVQAYREQVTPAAFADDVLARVQADLADGLAVGLDLSYRAIVEEQAPAMVPYMDALELRLEQHLWVQRVDDPLWPLMRLRQRP